ncbi:MAG: TonB-dependent receptor [Saprospiraceae bacterium]|nr:TonB-dependent receptor [Saprospiraceae bacterium]
MKFNFVLVDNKQFIFSFLLFLLSFSLFSQSKIRGLVKDGSKNDALIGAAVVIKGTSTGVSTDFDGNFELNVPSLPVTLVVSYIGYTSKDVAVSSTKELLSVFLEEENTTLVEVQVKGQRISEKQKESPLTVEALDLIAIKETPAANFYNGLGNLKGVDLTTASLGFTIINTRGFNSTSPVRSLQIIDGVDNQAPGLNFSLGNFLGSSELDVLKVDLIVGASSAFYGPNAFNGVISMETKNPFYQKGLSAMVKIGERQMFESAIRWADAIKNKKGQEWFAYKLNFFALTANDWQADNTDPVLGTKTGRNNPGRWDKVNTYGDEYNRTFDFSDFKKTDPLSLLGIFHRTGYNEKDIVDYHTKNIKANAALHFRTNPSQVDNSPELILSSSFGNGTTVYQGDNRFSLKDILFFQNRIEFRKRDKFFLRAYSTNEDAGNSYDPYFTALLMQQKAKSNDTWLGDYFLTPGTPEFKTEFDRIRTMKSNKRDVNSGSRFYDKSALYHIHGEYKITPKWTDQVTVGANLRLYRPNSAGTIFFDTSGTTIKNYEYGIYTGIEKKLLNNKIKLNGSLRMDKNQNFNYLFSPAASVVYQPDKLNFLRFSFSSAIRNPTLTDQYLYLDVGPAILAGNLYGVKDLVSVESFSNYLNKLDRTLLDSFDINPIRPEKVKSFEVGYRTTLFDKIYMDASYYFSFYNDFIGYQIGITSDFDKTSGLPKNVQPYRFASNSQNQVTTQGFSLGLNYYFAKYYQLSGNYSWNKLNKLSVDDPIIPAFNTPENKFNVGISARDLVINIGKSSIENIGFSVNYKWIQGFNYEGSPQFTGFVPTYDMVDAQINYKIIKLNTTIKLGASNLFDNKQFQTYGGPRIGRMGYLSLTYDFQKK